MKHYLVLSLFFSSLTLGAQEMRIQKNNGTVETILLSEIVKITFSVSGDSGKTLTDPRDGLKTVISDGLAA